MRIPVSVFTRTARFQNRYSRWLYAVPATLISNGRGSMSDLTTALRTYIKCDRGSQYMGGNLAFARTELKAAIVTNL